MATYNGEQYTKAYVTLPYAPAESGIVKGKELFMLETLDLADVGATLTDGDFIKIGSKLPKGARVTDLRAILPVDASGVLDFGYEANGAIAADTKGFIDGAANASVISDIGAAASTRFKQFTAETQLVAEVITTFTGAVGVLKVAVFYVID